MINKDIYKTYGLQKGAVFKTNGILQGAFLFLCFQKYICFGIKIHESTHLRCRSLERHALYKSEISVILSLIYFEMKCYFLLQNNSICLKKL